MKHRAKKTGLTATLAVETDEPLRADAEKAMQKAKRRKGR